MSILIFNFTVGTLSGCVWPPLPCSLPRVSQLGTLSRSLWHVQKSLPVSFVRCLSGTCTCQALLSFPGLCPEATPLSSFPNLKSMNLY